MKGDKMTAMCVPTYHLEVDFGVFRRGLLEVDPTPVGASVSFSKVFDPEERKGLGALLEPGPGAQADPVVPVSSDPQAFAPHVETATNT